MKIIEWFFFFAFHHQLTPGLQSQLKTAWPNLRLNGADADFWRTQWNKHGTCSLSTFQQLGYFQRALDLWRNDNITSILRNNGISPRLNTPYPKSDILKAIRTSRNIGVDPELICFGNYLLEIRLCLDPTGAHYIPCPRTSGGRCPADIIFPV